MVYNNSKALYSHRTNHHRGQPRPGPWVPRTNSISAPGHSSEVLETVRGNIVELLFPKYPRTFSYQILFSPQEIFELGFRRLIFFFFVVYDLLDCSARDLAAQSAAGGIDDTADSVVVLPAHNDVQADDEEDDDELIVMPHREVDVGEVVDDAANDDHADVECVAHLQSGLPPPQSANVVFLQQHGNHNDFTAVDDAAEQQDGDHHEFFVDGGGDDSSCSQDGVAVEEQQQQQTSHLSFSRKRSAEDHSTFEDDQSHRHRRQRTEARSPSIRKG